MYISMQNIEQLAIENFGITFHIVKTLYIYTSRGAHFAHPLLHPIQLSFCHMHICIHAIKSILLML